MKRILPSLLALTLLAGCGVSQAPMARAIKPGAVSSLSKAGAEKGVRAAFKFSFAALDADKNGSLSLEELPLPEGAPVDPVAARQAELARLDVNKDNKVSLREFSRPELVQPAVQRFRNMVGQTFAQLDANGDRMLSPEEATRLPAAFEEVDRNKNGKLTLSEYEDALATFYGQTGSVDFNPPAPEPATPDPDNGDQSYDPADDPGDEPTDS